MRPATAPMPRGNRQIVSDSTLWALAQLMSCNYVLIISAGHHSLPTWTHHPLPHPLHHHHRRRHLLQIKTFSILKTFGDETLVSESPLITAQPRVSAHRRRLWCRLPGMIIKGTDRMWLAVIGTSCFKKRAPHDFDGPPRTAAAAAAAAPRH